jgi:hypothetical protein
MIFGNLPSEIESKLYEFSDKFFSQNLDEIKGLAEKKLDTEYAVSNEYLAEMKARPDNVGFPEEAYGYDFKAFQHSSDWNAIMHELDKTLIMPDKKGWSIKVGYYDTVKGNPLWHAAHTNCNRLNWAYVIHPILWEDFANEIGVSRDAICEIIGRDPEELIEAYESGYR